MQQSDTEDAVHFTVIELNIKSGGLEGSDPPDNILRLPLPSYLKHLSRVVSSKDYSIRVLAEQRPEAACATRQIQNLCGIARKLKCLSCNLHIPPMGNSSSQTILMLSKVLLSMVVVLAGKFELDRVLLEHEIALQMVWLTTLEIRASSTR